MVIEEKENQNAEGLESNPTDTQTKETPVAASVAPPDEKKVRGALAGDESFELGDVQLEEIVPGDNDPAPEAPTKETPPAEKKPDSTQTQPTQSELKTQWMWERLKGDYEKQFGEGSFKAPEGITPETEYEAVLDFFQKNLEPDISEFPEEIQEQINLHRSGQYDPNKYFETRTSSNDITTLPDRDFLFEIYKAKHGKSEQNATGLSDDDIEDFLSKKSKLELIEMAQAARGQVKQIQEQYNKQKQEKATEIAKQQFEQMQTNEITAASKIVNQLKSDRNFFGIEFSPEEKAQFDKDFVELVKFNPETKTQKLAEMLQDHKTLYKVAGILWKGEDLKGYITNLKEGVKQETERKLDPTLDKEKGSTKIARPVDRGKLV